MTDQPGLAASLLETIGAVVCVMDMDGRIVIFNKAARELTGYTESETLDKYPWDFLILPNEVNRVKTVFRQLSIGNFPNSNINYWRTKAGEDLLISWSNTALADASGNISYIIATGIDITQQRKAEQELLDYQKNLERIVEVRTAELNALNKQLELIAYKDPLTDIYNRRYLMQAISKELHSAARHDYEISVLMLDVDYFKQYNDAYGHLQGDECLRRIAQLLKSHFQRMTDVVARYGGEEFCVLLPGIDESQAMHMSEMFRHLLEQANIEHSASPIAGYITMSIGITTCSPTFECNAERLLETADSALYIAKQNGRNQIRKNRINALVGT